MTTAILSPSCTVTVADIEVVPESGQVTLDETQAYATASYTISVLSNDLVDEIDPRDDIRTTIVLNGRLFDLGVRERTVDHAAGKMTIRASSDEALIADWRPIADDGTPVAYAASLRSMVNYVLDLVIPGAALEASPNPDQPIAETDALHWQAGIDAWEFMLTFTMAAGLRLFCDELRKWRLVPASYVAPGTVSAVPANSRDGSDTLSRDGESWATGVAVIYEWTDDTGAHRVVDSAGVYGKVSVFRFNTAYPGPGAAAMRLNRLRGQGRTQSAVCFADYTATPGMEARFSLPGTFDQIGRLQRVTFPLLDGYMELGARELTEVPPTSYIFGTPGISYDDVPVGMSYDTFEWSGI